MKIMVYSATNNIKKLIKDFTMRIIERKKEQEALRAYVDSDSPEFLVVYGRRRVGKTFLVREFFNNHFAFHVTGMAKSSKATQIANFSDALQKHSARPIGQIETWFDAFVQLRDMLESFSTTDKKVLFIDEMPWLDTHKSGFLQSLEWFWNSWASGRSDILLIVCGSATTWIINKLFNNHGGLHNRVTKKMYVAPFTLAECEEYYKQKGIVMNRYQMVESYMILGGIPYYLSYMQKNLSLPQNIDEMFFVKDALLKDEYNNLYSSLFKFPGNHIKVIEALSRKTIGMTRAEIIESSGLSDGGALTKVLDELEGSRFIEGYPGFVHEKKGIIYRLIDFYSLFFLQFLNNKKGLDEHFWSNFSRSGGHNAWRGYAFEQVCLAHVKQIKAKLGISGVLANTFSWRSTELGTKAQIDLVIDRRDETINLCEMKYTGSQYVIDNKYEKELLNKIGAFTRETKTRSAVHLTMVTTYGIKLNPHAGIVQSEVTIDDLFARV